MTRWPYPRIVAHRGGGTLAPENTLGAMRLGASMGFKGVEFDVMLAGDGTPVIIHDETVERTTNGRGAVPDMTYAELAALKIEKGERIPKFEEAGRLCRELGIWANVEIKPAKGHERATGQAVAPLARELWRGAALPPVLSSFSVEALEAARDAAPELPRGYLVSTIPQYWRETMQRLGCVALHCNYQALTRELAAEIHGAGYAILLWTVNKPETARQMFALGADCLVTDALDRIGPDF
ncbi:MAG TPA: glycerophosphodiester phosphodiesterase [Burkholderiales bacterium]|jgi:glycerophosphoryl diester phosphodiesterase